VPDKIRSGRREDRVGPAGPLVGRHRAQGARSAGRELGALKRGAIVIGLLNPYDKAAVESYARAGLTCFAMEWLPRTTRAQSMDVLSSQANIGGYKAVIVAAMEYGRFMRCS